MGQIKHYNNGKWTIYTSGEGLSGYTGVTNTYYVGADLDNNGNLSKANPDGSLVNLETGIRPYKVYTALLTQTGGSNPLAVSGDGEYINFGVTYEIVENPDNYDLTIYGAPNNNVGTYFVSNQTIALPYTVSLQLLTNTGAPVATVLENTIGNIWFSYLDVGIYNINSNELFTNNKTFVNVSPTVQNAGDSIGQTVQFVGGAESTINTLVIQTLGAGQDGIPNRTAIEIRVYN